jgi:hypothetical protein
MNETTDGFIITSRLQQGIHKFGGVILYFFAVLEFELTVSHLLDKLSTT